MREKLFKSIYYLISGLEKKQLNRIFLITVLIFISALLEAVGISLVIPLVSIIFDPNYLSKNEVFGVFFSNKLQTNIIFSLLIILGLFFIFKNLFVLFLNWTQNKLINSISLEMSQRLYKTYLNSPYQFHAKSNKSQLYNNISHVTSFISGLESLMNLITESLILLSILSVLLYFEFIGTLLILIIFILFSGIIFMFTSQKLANWGKFRFQFFEKKLRNVTQTLTAIKEIKILNRQKYFFDEFTENEKKDLNISNKEKIINLVPRLTFEIAFIVCISSFLIYKLNFDFKTSETIALLALYAAAFFRVFPSALRIIFNINRIINVSKIIKEIFNEFRINEVKKINYNKEEKNFLFKEKIVIRDLSFKFDESKKNIINSVNFDIKFGEKVGIVGETGSGKSTLVNLISGLIKPQSGEILVDGNDINKSSKSWYMQLGYVFPETFLTNESIKQNIAFGVEEKKIDNNLINHAVIKSELFDFIENLNEKIETKIGEFGAKISSGQRQRIGIARALYHTPKLLILDEATSALNLEVEKKILNNLIKLGKNITILIISHRESTLVNCDKIFRVEDGVLNRIK